MAAECRWRTGRCPSHHSRRMAPAVSLRVSRNLDWLDEQSYDTMSLVGSCHSSLGNGAQVILAGGSVMIQGNSIDIRLVRDIGECQLIAESYNDLSQRAKTDHTEIKPVAALVAEFDRNGLWGEAAGTCVVTDKESNTLGLIGFKGLSRFELELGYRLFSREHRGCGYMGEALPLFSSYLFATKQIERLRIQTAIDNIESLKIAERSGYKREGVLRKGTFYRGEFRDFVILGLLREECPEFSVLAKDKGGLVG